MVLRNCHNFHDFRRLAKRRLPGPIFNYIDGAVTLMVEQALQGSGRAIDRQRELLAHDGNG